LRRSNFQLPAAEDDLWHQIIVRLLAQRDKAERQAASQLRLLEEWAFHRVFCGQRKVNRGWLERVAEWIVETEPRRGPLEEVDQWIDDLEDWDFICIDADGNYEFKIPTMDEYFAARHLATRWDEEEERYREWLPCSYGWWERGEELYCPNPHCGTTLPPFRDLHHKAEYEEIFLIIVGLLKKAEREEIYVKGIREINLKLKAVSRCRHEHPDLIQALQFDIVVEVDKWRFAEGLNALGRARNRYNLERIINYIVHALRDWDWMIPKYYYSGKALYGVRQLAASALVEIGHAAVEPLVSLLKDKNWTVDPAAADALGLIRDVRAVAPLILLLGNENEYVRWAATNALGRIADVRSIKPLITKLSDEDNRIRRSAVEALGNISDTRAVEPVKEILSDEDASIRSSAVKALGKIGDARAIPALQKALEDPVKWVRDYAQKALEKIGY